MFAYIARQFADMYSSWMTWCSSGGDDERLYMLLDEYCEPYESYPHPQVIVRD